MIPDNPLDFTGKAVLVTGGGVGIGRGIAETEPEGIGNGLKIPGA